MKFEILKEHYFFELNRKQALDGALALPVAVLTGIGSVAFTLATTFDYKNDYLTLLFAALLFANLVCLGCAFSFICIASVRHTYELAPSPSDLLKYLEDLKKYYASTGAINVDIDKEFEDNLKQRYAKATTNNKNSNTSKASFLYRANVSLVLGVLFIAFCAIPYAIKLKLKQPEPQKIEIVNTKSQEVSLMSNGEKTDQTTAVENSNAPNSQSEASQESSLVDIYSKKPEFPNNSNTKMEKPVFPSNERLKDGETNKN